MVIVYRRKVADGDPLGKDAQPHGRCGLVFEKRIASSLFDDLDKFTRFIFWITALDEIWFVEGTFESKPPRQRLNLPLLRLQHLERVRILLLLMH